MTSRYSNRNVFRNNLVFKREISNRKSADISNINVMILHVVILFFKIELKNETVLSTVS